VHREVQAEGSRRQNAGLTNRNRIRGVPLGWGVNYRPSPKLNRNGGT